MRRAAFACLIAFAAVLFACKIKVGLVEDSSVASAAGPDWLTAADTLHFSCSSGTTQFPRKLDLYMNLTSYQYYVVQNIQNTRTYKKRGIGGIDLDLTPEATSVATETVRYNMGKFSGSVARKPSSPNPMVTVFEEGSGDYSGCTLDKLQLVKFEL